MPRKARVEFPGAVYHLLDRGPSQDTARGQLKNVQTASQQPFVSYTYLVDGKVDHENYLNGIQSTFGYDGRGMISSITPQKAHQQTLASRQYFRDNRDRITTWNRKIARDRTRCAGGSGGVASKQLTFHA
jgi:hypothetical protein